MKGKIYVLILAALALIITVSITVVTAEKQYVVVPSTIMSTQQLKITSNEKLSEKSIKNGLIYVTNTKGEKLPINMSFLNEHEIELGSLPIGSYQIHIDKKAFSKSNVLTKNKTLTFRVIEKLATIQSDEELANYFKAVQSREEQASKNRGFKMSMEEESLSGSEAASDKSHSTTNNQVEGIEEADVTVTDGKTIFTIGQNGVYLIDAQRANNMKLLSEIKLPLDTYINQLLLHKDLLIISYNEHTNRYYNGEYIYEDYSKLAIYDVKNPASPKLVREFGHEGNVIALRKIDHLLYFVSQTTPLYWHFEDVDRLKPAIYDSEVGETVRIDSKKISILPNAEEPMYTTISVIDLKDGLKESIQTDSYLGSSSSFYMSHEAMYLTVAKYSYRRNISDRIAVVDEIALNPTETNIYRFSVDGMSVQFAGQAAIKGSILNQFSMDEHNGYFRVAITSGNTRGANADSTSAIHIFDGNMNEVGKVTDLAKGERIYSARFMGDRAFIVTFKETDPLFTFDLSNPRNPKVLGELKIPGFSTYLHPIGENHLLGLGYDTSLQRWEGSSEAFVRQEGLKLSLFNVEDLNNPIEQDVEFIGGQGSYSQAIDSHKAFFIHKGKNYYGFPVSLYNYRNERNPFIGQGAMLYKVTPEKGIELAANLVESVAQNYEVWEEMPQRMIYINNTLYLVALNSVKSYDLTTFEELNKLYLK